MLVHATAPIDLHTHLGPGGFDLKGWKGIVRSEVCVCACLYFMVYIFYLVLVKGGNVFIITPLPLLSVITNIFSSASFSSQMVAAFCSLTINK